MGLIVMLASVLGSNEGLTAVKENGYRGVWYSNQPSGDEFAYKYSGGLGTYTAKHIPLAVYAPEVDKTFFVYGGSRSLSDPTLLVMAGCYDHAAGLVAKPTVILEKSTGGDKSDAHHNPSLAIDGEGYLWVFAASHGRKDSFIFRSRKPYSIDGFDQVIQKEFSYPQPWYFDRYGMMFLFTKYTAGRELYVSTSRDGFNWTEDRKIVGFGGHYQVSWAYGKKRATAFNWHPPKGGLNARTNLYYMETTDYGQTWTTASGKPLNIPLDSPQNEALIRDFQKEGLLVYMKDLNFDRDGRPVILFVVSKGYKAGPENQPRVWMTARWTGDEWEFREMTTSDHNYDMGSLYIEPDGTWRVIAPTEPGPQAYSTGGEMVVWTSSDCGKSWKKVRQLTRNSRFNHTYARRPCGAHPGFYTFWADGNPLEPSESTLYFATKGGEVYALPRKITSDWAAPEKVESSQCR